MLAISFAWTTAAVRARRKTVTRRQWTDYWAHLFARAFERNELIAALDKDRRAGGKQFGTIRLTRAPYQESESLMPDEDYEGEGFAFLDEYPQFKPAKWRGASLRELFGQSRLEGAVVYVVRFEVVDLVEPLTLPDRLPDLDHVGSHVIQ
ncbi:MAG: hypothetical protein WCF84_18740 [Anaerolineae bacterium]